MKPGDIIARKGHPEIIAQIIGPSNLSEADPRDPHFFPGSGELRPGSDLITVEALDGTADSPKYRPEESAYRYKTDPELWEPATSSDEQAPGSSPR